MFDVIIRYSGAAARTEIGPIANTFGRHAEVTAPWVWQVQGIYLDGASVASQGIEALARASSDAISFCLTGESR